MHTEHAFDPGSSPGWRREIGTWVTVFGTFSQFKSMMRLLFDLISSVTENMQPACFTHSMMILGSGHHNHCCCIGLRRRQGQAQAYHSTHWLGQRASSCSHSCSENCHLMYSKSSRKRQGRLAVLILRHGHSEQRHDPTKCLDVLTWSLSDLESLLTWNIIICNYL